MTEDKKALEMEQLNDVAGGVDRISGKGKKEQAAIITDKVTTLANVLDDADEKSKTVL